jgi:membrane fusion protein (multidrug efflux system)
MTHTRRRAMPNWAGVAALTAGVLGLVQTAAWAQASPARPKTAEVATSTSAMERQEIRAQLLPRRYTTMAAEIGARINRLPISEGGAFKAGQLLVGFDCSLQQAQLQKAQAELEGAELTLKANQRMAELNSVGQLELDLSRSAVSRARAEIGSQQAMLSKCSVLAPFAGRLAEQKVREQQFVQPGQALVDVIDDSVLELEFLVPSRWLAWLRSGGSFQVHIDETRKSYPARFIRIGARVDPVSQSVKVAAAIDGKFPELIAGMSGRVQITVPSSEPALPDH